jgi:hypothetical protein
MLYNPNPSYGTGYARNKAESEYPGLWDGLVGYWPFFLGATGTTAHDHSGGKHAGTLTNGPVWGAGLLTLDGFNEHVTVPAAVDRLPGDMSISIFLSSAAGGSEDYIFSDWGANKNYLLEKRAAGNLVRYLVGDGGGNQDAQLLSTTAVGTSVMHIVALREGTFQALYINGKLEDSQTGLYTGGTTAHDRNIGGDRAPTNNFTWQGDILQMALYNRRLTANQIEQFYEIPRALLIPRRRIFGFVAAAPAGIEIFRRRIEGY